VLGGHLRDPESQGRGGAGGPGNREPGRGLAQAAYLRVARGAVMRVALELLPLRAADGVESVAAGEHVQVVTQELHHVTSEGPVVAARHQGQEGGEVRRWFGAGCHWRISGLLMLPYSGPAGVRIGPA
jgi:hypothetical protein